MNMEHERAEFERWAGDYGRVFRERDGDGYAYTYTQEAWVGWLARAALAAGNVWMTGLPLDRLRALVTATQQPAVGPRLDAPVRPPFKLTQVQLAVIWMLQRRALPPHGYWVFNPFSAWWPLAA